MVQVLYALFFTNIFGLIDYSKWIKFPTKFSLFGCPGEEECNKNQFEETTFLAKQLNDGMPYQFKNFLLAEKATEFEVEIIWTQKGSEGRPLKVTFTFTAE